jgi:hypothetical protein
MKTITALCMGAALALGLPALAAGSARFTLGPADYDSIAIVRAADRPMARFAAAELQQHLALLTGRVVPVVEEAGSRRKAFLVGISPPGAVPPPAGRGGQVPGDPQPGVPVWRGQPAGRPGR